MVEKLHPGVIGYGTNYAHGLESTMPEWLHNSNWKAYLDRYPLKQEKSPVFFNEMRIIEDIAGPIIAKVLDLTENSDRKGVVLTIANRGKVQTPSVAILYGEIKKPDPVYGEKLYKYTDYARLKANFLLNNPALTASQENLSLPEEKQWITYIDGNKIPGGAIAFENGFILSMSGLSTGEKDTAAVLAIGIEAHLIRPQVARKLARRFNCLQSLTQITDVLRADG